MVTILAILDGLKDAREGRSPYIAFVVAVLPYLLIRGPAARIARRLNRRGAAYNQAQ
jgi:hypothetical protein